MIWTWLRALIAQHPDWHRTALSRHLCELWNWRNGAGRLKDMAARTLLLKLHARGLIELPPPQNNSRSMRGRKKEYNLSTQFVALTQEIRDPLNQTGYRQKRLLQVGDGSFCNSTVMRQDWEAQPRRSRPPRFTNRPRRITCCHRA